MPLIFNGVRLVAHHNPGNSAYLLVTFIGAFHEQEAETDYLMKGFVEREGIACVGVTSRRRDLYLSDEIGAIADAVRELRRPGQKLIMLGQSSGGYAAIKYADRFGADAVMSFSPIFSMDEDDLGITPEMEYERWVLNSAIRFHRVPDGIIHRGMRPGPEDCAAPLVLVHDLHNQNDSYAAARYERLFPEARFVRTRNLGHAVFDQIEGTMSSSLSLALLDHAANGDVDGTHRLLSRLIRNSDSAIAELLARVARWRPAMVPVALRTERVRLYLKAETRERHAFNIFTAYEFIARGDAAAAYAHLHATFPQMFPADGQDSGLFLVLSYHGDILTYDKESAEVRLEPGTLYTSGRPPVLLEMGGPAPSRFLLPLRSGDLPVVADRKSAAGGDAGFEVVPVDGKSLVSFRRGSAFLRADHACTPMFTASEALEWEQFALLPLRAPDMVRQASLNWLDQAVMAAQSSDEAPASSATPVARKKAFRSIIQRFFAG